MTTLQEYLDQKYPTKEDKEKVTEIDIRKIRSKRRKEGITELLEGDELDLREFKNLKKLSVFCHLPCSTDSNFLETQLTKLDVSKCFKLSYLDCSFNKLTFLDLSNSIELVELDLS